MIRAVLDTNVLASAIAGVDLPNSTPGELLRRWRQAAFVLVLSDHILLELERTLTEPYFHDRASPEQQMRILTTFRRHSEQSPITVPVAGVATHPEDDLVLAAALSARVPFLVTGDHMLLKRRNYQKVDMVAPRDFLRLLDQESIELPR